MPRSTRKNRWPLLIVLVSMLLLSACGATTTTTTAGGSPTITPTMTVPPTSPPPTMVPPTPTPTFPPTPDTSQHIINNNDPAITYTGTCGYNHGLSGLLYNDDVEICHSQGDSFTYAFTGVNIWMETVYDTRTDAEKGGTWSCGIDGSGTFVYDLSNSNGTPVDAAGFAYQIYLPIAPQLVYGPHTASCTQTSTTGYTFLDALIVNKS